MVKKQELTKPTSMLTKFVHDRTRTIINSTKMNLKKSFKYSIDTFNVSKKKGTKYNNIFLTNDGSTNNKDSDENCINTFLENYNNYKKPINNNII